MKKIIAGTLLALIGTANTAFALSDPTGAYISTSCTYLGPNSYGCSVSFNWNDNSNDETSYEVQYSVDAGSNYTSVGLPANSTSVGGYFETSNGGCKVTLHGKVRAFNGGTASGWNSSSFVTLPGGTVNCY